MKKLLVFLLLATGAELMPSNPTDTSTSIKRIVAALATVQRILNSYPYVYPQHHQEYNCYHLHSYYQDDLYLRVTPCVRTDTSSKSMSYKYFHTHPLEINLNRHGFTPITFEEKLHLQRYFDKRLGTQRTAPALPLGTKITLVDSHTKKELLGIIQAGIGFPKGKS